MDKIIAWLRKIWDRMAPIVPNTEDALEHVKFKTTYKEGVGFIVHREDMGVGQEDYIQ